MSEEISTNEIVSSHFLPNYTKTKDRETEPRLGPLQTSALWWKPTPKFGWRFRVPGRRVHRPLFPSHSPNSWPMITWHNTPTMLHGTHSWEAFHHFEPICVKCRNIQNPRWHDKKTLLYTRISMTASKLLPFSLLVWKKCKTPSFCFAYVSSNKVLLNTCI